MALELQTVQSNDQLIRCLANFNRDARKHPDRTHSILTQTTYWVWSPDFRIFGPSKFVGYRDMSFDRYETASRGETKGAGFDGGTTHQAIEKMLGPFRADAKLIPVLRAWAEGLAGPGVFDRVDEEKWRFVEMRPAVGADVSFEIGKVYDRRRDIHGRFGGQRQGGISTPASGSFIFLFTGESGEQYGYKDGWSGDDVFLYTGEGQLGDMEFRGGNKAIRDHIQDGKDLLLFSALGKGKGYRFVGEFQCASWQYREGPDAKRQPRKVIVFHLLQLNVPTDVGEGTDGPATGSVSGRDLDELREKAIQAANPAPLSTAKEARVQYYARSAAVRAYVLARANGTCESCRQPAPFLRSDGTPYLEPHHTKRLSDGGPDDPRSVAGICPTCHRKIHYGTGGVGVNDELKRYLAAIEGAADPMHPKE